MRHWQIRDVDGNVLWEGAARTKRDFVAKLIEQGKSFARADFSGDTSTLDRVNLSGINLTNARLDNCCLRACNLKNAQLQGASLVNAKLICADLEGAVLDGCDLTDADFTSAVATRAHFRGVTINRTNFSQMAASSSVFNYARGRDTNFTEAKLRNVVFNDCTLMSPDFSGADLGHQMLGVKSEDEAEDSLAKHLPNRTQGSIVIGGTYDKETHIPKTTPAMSSDRKTSRLARMALWTSTSIGMFIGVENATEYLSNCGVLPHLGAGIEVVAVMGAAYFLKELAVEYARDYVADKLNDIFRVVRQGFKDLDRMGGNRMQLVCAMTKGRSAEPLKLALDATQKQAGKRGFWSSFKSFWCNLGNVIVCDRRHLAVALGTLSANRRQACELPCDVVLMRCDKPIKRSEQQGSTPLVENCTPCVVTFHKDGRSSAIWPLDNGKHAKTIYSQEGDLIECRDHVGETIAIELLNLPAACRSRLDTAFAFEARLLEDQGLKDFKYPRQTHSVLVGQDGSILVQRESDRRVDNPDAHALIKPDLTGVYVVHGSVRSGPKNPEKTRAISNPSDHMEIDETFMPAI